ncbi:MAG: FkbM family methyltransferase, partial [Dehalococcoidia bacterium]|nr:FkbM family methyltransferase [Dehalococcoidia bacterium]
NKITNIDFFKTDCEGAEYDIFNSQNLEWIKSNVKKIAGEWHLSTRLMKEKFINFRDHFLSYFDSYQVLSVDGTDIKWDLPNKHFIEHYTEIMLYIDNRA